MKRWMIFVIGGLMSLQVFGRQYQTFEENGKVGMKDEEGHVVLPPSFEALGWSDGSFSVVGEVTGYRLQGLWGIVNLKKEFLTKAEYENLTYSGGDNVTARKKVNSLYRKAGCLNLRGEIKIPFVYDGIQAQSLRAIVFNLSKGKYRYGLVDHNNKSILPVIYKYIKPLGTLRYAAENDNGKIALFNEDGNMVTDFVIDSVSSFYKNYAVIFQDHLQGLIDRDGNTKLETKYQSIKISEDGKVFAQLPNEWSFVNEKNETTTHIFTDELRPLSRNLFYYKKGKHWGLINDELRLVVPAQYARIFQVEQNRYLVAQDSRMGVIDEQGKSVIPFEFDSLVYTQGMFLAFTKGLGWRLIDSNGKILSDRFYQAAHSLDNENFIVTSKGFYGLVNSRGKEFVHCVFDSIAAPIKDLIAVKFKGKYGIINANEDWLVAPQDFPLQVINEKIYLQKQPRIQFIKTFAGETKYFSLFQLTFRADDFKEVFPNGTENVISYDGSIIHRVIPPDNTQEIFRESEGLRGMKKDGRYGFVDANGNLRIANRYDSIGEFHEGLGAVKLIGKWGFVNENDHVAINPNYDYAANFQNGLAIVSRGKKMGVINKNGNTVLQFRYDFVQRQQNSFLLTSSNLKGLADFSGNVTIEPRFDELIFTTIDLVIACRDGKCGAITSHGLSVIPIIYDQLIFNSSKNAFLAERKSEWKEVPLN